MIDKIKNFIFDIKNIVIVVAIIAVLVLSITWKIGNTMDIDLDKHVVVSSKGSGDNQEGGNNGDGENTSGRLCPNHYANNYHHYYNHHNHPRDSQICRSRRRIRLGHYK